MQSFLGFEKSIAELEGKMEELRHLNDIEAAGPDRTDLATDLFQTVFLAEGSGGAASQSSALHRLYRRAGG